jgi:hypothetical protein
MRRVLGAGLPGGKGGLRDSIGWQIGSSTIGSAELPARAGPWQAMDPNAIRTNFIRLRRFGFFDVCFN